MQQLVSSKDVDIRLYVRTMIDEREAKCFAEEKARKALSDNEEYRWIIKMADAVEDDYEFLIFHTEDEGMKEIDRIEERMVKGVREFKERSNS